MAAEFDILWPAFLAGLLILATHVPLGRLVLDRGIVFVDLAIAQMAGLGVVVADVMGHEPQGWSVQISAALAALLGSAFLVWTEKRLADVQEAIIGTLFVVAASAELVLLGFNPHGAEHLKDLLVGQILWVEPSRLLWVLGIYALLSVIIWTTDLVRRRLLFYVVFALAVTVSVQLAGVLLVFASLIVPPLAAKIARSARPLPLAFGLGVTGYGLGLVGSALFDLPTGAAIVCALALVACVHATIALSARWAVS